MLLRPSSLSPSFGGVRERECPRCHREVDLPLGDLCAACQREIDGRAARVARWVSLGTTAVFGLYATAVLPLDRTTRMVGAAATVAWYLIVRRVAQRVAREWFLTR
jgi:hypothetical protein